MSRIMYFLSGCFTQLGGLDLVSCTSTSAGSKVFTVSVPILCIRQWPERNLENHGYEINIFLKTWNGNLLFNKDQHTQNPDLRNFLFTTRNPQRPSRYRLPRSHPHHIGYHRLLPFRDLALVSSISTTGQALAMTRDHNAVTETLVVTYDTQKLHLGVDNSFGQLLAGPLEPWAVNQ